jgi:hypothetical protein
MFFSVLCERTRGEQKYRFHHEKSTRLRLKWKHSRDMKRSQERPTFSLEGRLDGLPLRVSNEGSPRPRVARAQEINMPRPTRSPGGE